MNASYSLFALLLSWSLSLFNCSGDRQLSGMLWEHEGQLCLKGIYVSDGPMEEKKDCWKCSIRREGEYIQLKDILDVDTYQEIGLGYFKDKNQVYYWYKMAFCGGHVSEVGVMDRETIVQIGDTQFLKDKDRVYHYRGGVLKGANPKTFEPLVAWYGRDGDKYYDATRIMTDAKEIAEIDSIAAAERER